MNTVNEVIKSPIPTIAKLAGAVVAGSVLTLLSMKVYKLIKTPKQQEQAK